MRKDPVLLFLLSKNKTTTRSFLDYVGRWGEYEEYDKLKVEDEQSFITALRDVSLSSDDMIKT